MKMRKTLAAVASMAMAASMVSAFSTTASAITEGKKVDFEDGDCSFVYMNVDDEGADASVLSVEEYDGSKQLKVDVQNPAKAPKVWFDLDKITDRANTVNISSIEFDMTLVPKNEDDVIGWAGGAIGAAGGFDMEADGKGQVDPNWSSTDWACEDNNAYTEGMPAKVHVTRKFILPSTKYTETGINPFFGIMRWAVAPDNETKKDHAYVMYVDNIVLKDSAGNALPVGVFAAAEETEADLEEGTEADVVEEATEAEVVEEATEAEVVDEAPVEDAEVVEDAPVVTEAEVVVTEEVVTEAPVAAPVATTPVAPTGNAPIAVMAGVMALAGAAAVISKRK